MIGRKCTQVGGYETRFDDEGTFLWEVVEIVSGNLMGSFTTEREAIEFATKIATCPRCGDRTNLVPSTGGMPVVQRFRLRPILPALTLAISSSENEYAC